MTLMQLKEFLWDALNEKLKIQQNKKIDMDSEIETHGRSDEYRWKIKPKKTINQISKKIDGLSQK